MSARRFGAELKPDALRFLIFDIDGTLYDQARVRRGMALRLLRFVAHSPRTGLKTFSFLAKYRAAQEHVRGRATANDQMSEACRGAGVETAWGEACVAEWMERRPLDLIARAMYCQLPALLGAAKRRGLSLAVVSDYPAQKKLEVMGINRYFDFVVTPAEVASLPLKPNPAGLLEAVERIGCDRSAAVYIGDRPEVDGEAAARANIPSVIVGRHSMPPGNWTAAPTFASLPRTLGLTADSHY